MKSVKGRTRRAASAAKRVSELLHRDLICSNLLVGAFENNRHCTFVTKEMVVGGKDEKSIMVLAAGIFKG